MTTRKRKTRAPIDLGMIAIVMEDDDESIMLSVHHPCPHCPDGHRLLLAQLNRKAFASSEPLTAVIDDIAMLLGKAVIAEISGLDAGNITTVLLPQDGPTAEDEIH